MTIADNILTLRQLVSPGAVAMLTATTTDGELHSRPLTVSEIDDSGNVSFIVDTRAAWITDLNNGQPVNVAVTMDTGSNWASIAGTVDLVSNPEVIDRLWVAEIDALFPDGKDSPNVKALRVLTTSAEYWDATERSTGRITTGVVDRESIFGTSETIELS